jgi:hypothetical protein
VAILLDQVYCSFNSIVTSWRQSREIVQESGA